MRNRRSAFPRRPATATSTGRRSWRCSGRWGICSLDDEGIASEGLIIRHLVLPERAAGSRETLRWIAENLGTETHVALMNQYFPAHEAHETRRHCSGSITDGEYEEAVAALEECGLENGWVQE